MAIGDSVIVVSADAFGSQAAERFRVVGTFHVGADELDGFGALADLAALQEFLGVGDGLSHVAVFARRGAPLPALDRARCARRFPPTATRCWTGSELVPELVAFMKLNDVGDWMQNALLLIVVAFGLLNTILMSVFERVREFGVLRALGLRPRAVFGLVVLESMLLSLLGIALGFAVGIPLVLWLTRASDPAHQPRRAGVAAGVRARAADHVRALARPARRAAAGAARGRRARGAPRPRSAPAAAARSTRCGRPEEAMSTLLRIAWRNLWRGWRRSAIVVSAITVGLSACLLLIAWSHGWLEQIVQTAVGTRLGLVAVHAEGYQASPDVARSLGDGGRALGRSGASASPARTPRRACWATA